MNQNIEQKIDRLMANQDKLFVADETFHYRLSHLEQLLEPKRSNAECSSSHVRVPLIARVITITITIYDDGGVVVDGAGPGPCPF